MSVMFHLWGLSIILVWIDSLLRLDYNTRFVSFSSSFVPSTSWFIFKNALQCDHEFVVGQFPVPFLQLWATSMLVPKIPTSQFLVYLLHVAPTAIRVDGGVWDPR